MKDSFSLLEILLEWTGRLLLVTPLAMLVIQFSLVLSIYVFGASSIKLQESLAYINALMFLCGAGYTALHGGHVRVDIFYSGLSDRRKKIIDGIGSAVLLMPFLAYYSKISWPFIIASWAIREGSVETAGLPYIYLLKTCLLTFSVTLWLFAILQIVRAGEAYLEGRS